MLFVSKGTCVIQKREPSEKALRRRRSTLRTFIYAAGFICSALLNLISAFRKTAIVYIR